MAKRRQKEDINEIYGLNNLSTIDGRERPFTVPLRPFLSEAALHRHRAIVDVNLMFALADSNLERIPQITAEERAKIRKIVSPEAFDARVVAEYDHKGRTDPETKHLPRRKRKKIGPVEHDVKAVELYLRERFLEEGLGHLRELIHIFATSEDTNNIAWAVMIRSAVNKVWLPATLELCDKLAAIAQQHAHVAVIGRTHGMTASPTTIGKRFSYVLARLNEILGKMGQQRLSAKFSGPVGNYNAATAVVPEFDFPVFAEEFVEGFGLDYEQNANQRSSHLRIVEFLDQITHLNLVLVDLCENIRNSVKLGLLYQEGNPHHTGSSVMPHKINPWFFEVAQGYLKQSATLMQAAREHLLVSDFERDLTDHPWERAYGEMLAKSLVGVRYISQGLDTLHVDDQAVLDELQSTPEVLSEAVQIAGRLLGVSNIYMLIKAATRGKKLTREVLNEIIKETLPDGAMKTKLLELKTKDYTGKAAQIAQATVTKYKPIKARLEKGILDIAAEIDVVLLDFDNTLQIGDKDELIARLTEISARLGSGFDHGQIREFGNRSDYREMKTLMVKAHNDAHPSKKITPEDFQAANDTVTGTLDHHFKLAPQALELLEALKANQKKIGLVTTRGKQSLTRLLASHCLAEYFDVIVHRDSCSKKKPHPQPIAIALEELGYTDHSRVLFVGDSQTDDIGAGKAFGTKTVLVNHDELDKHGPKPDHHFKSLQPLVRLFGRNLDRAA